MTQAEVLGALKQLRKIDSNWHTAKQIMQFMRDNKLWNGSKKSIYSDLMRLAVFNLIEMKGFGAWDHHKEFRGFKL